MRTPCFNGRSAQERISLPTTATLFNPQNADTPLFRKADEFLWTEAHYVNGVLGRLMRTWSRQSSGAPSGLWLYLTSVWDRGVGVFRGCRGRSSGRRWTSSRSSISYLLTAAQRFLGSLSSFVTVRRRILRERERVLFAPVFSRSAGRGGSIVLFARVLCCCSVKLRETAIEQESLQASYSVLK